MTTEISHLSRELLPVTVTKNGVAVTTGIECSFNPQGVEAADDSWSPVDITTDGVIGYLYGGDQPVGFYVLTVRVNAGVEEPVLVSDLYRLK